MYRIGFTTVTFRKKNRTEICKIAKKNDINCIEWGGDVHVPPADSDAIDEVVRLQKENSVSAISYGSYYRLGMKDYTLWYSIVETAFVIGAKIIRIWQGDLSSCSVSDELLSDMITETIELSKIANDKNLIIAFEFHKGTNNDSGESAIRFIKAVDRYNVKTYWQPFGNTTDEENLRAVLPHLVGVHVFHWNENGKRYPLQKGENEWRRFIEIIFKSKISVNYVLEFVKGDKTRRFSRDVETLKKILGEIYGR